MKSFITLDDTSTFGELSPILTCIRSVQGSEALWENGKLGVLKSLSIKELRNEWNIKNEDGFCIAVSLQDGSTLYVSSSITTHLGYPKDMLVGQSIMNFLYQKDHITFANHLTQGLNACFTEGHKEKHHLMQNTFFCRFRVYHSLHLGYGLSGSKTQYRPFRVTMHINDLIFDDVCVEKSASTLCIKATATPLKPGYQTPEEIPAMTSFSTRHTASCHFSHVDESAIPYLGYLPQDMIGYSIFDFYHMDDMPQLKDIYESVVKEQGSSFRSKPYRFRVLNGCFITLETEWSCFINPWSRKLEFVVGQHRVLKGPSDISIFNPWDSEELTVADEMMKQSINIQKEIRNLLSQPIKNYGIDKAKRFCNKRKRDLASFVSNFIGDKEGQKNETGNEKQQNMDDYSHSDPDSVVMGDISPHRELNDSSASSETPSTFQEMRFQENIERFFASQPKTYSDGSEDYKSDEKQSTSEEDRVIAGSGKHFEDLSSVGPENRNQGTSSTSSKWNMSSFTTGDSGYGQSDGKERQQSVGVSNNAGQHWLSTSTQVDAEKLPLCLALTEESLTQHNRLNHKYLKHRKFKGHANSSYKDLHRQKHDEISQPNLQTITHKHKKGQRPHNTLATSIIPMQAEHATGSGICQPQPLFSLNPPFSVGCAGTPFTSHTSVTQPISSSSAFPSFGIPPYSYLPASATQAPCFMPVMYMGNIPCYTPMSNMVPPNGVPIWPCVPPMQQNSLSSLSPMFSSVSQMPNLYSANASQSFLSTFHATSNSTGNEVFGVQSSGATVTPLVLTTTTTVAPVTATSFKDKNTIALCSAEPQKNSNSKIENFRKYGSNGEDFLYKLQVKDSRPFGFAPTLNRTESINLLPETDYEMDFESNEERQLLRVRKNPPWLERVNLTSDVVFRYQLNAPDIEVILKKDREALKNMQQPDLVNKQLLILQNELEDENRTYGFSEKDDEESPSAIFGFATEEHDIKKSLDDKEYCFLQLMADDI